MSGHQHKKRFGQNFLNNSAIIDRIVKSIAPRESDHMIEIGPGEAALTAPLLDKVQKLDIIEIDNDLIPVLKHRFSHLPAFHLHPADALTFDYATLIEHNESVRVVGNLPYNISSPLLFHLMQYAPSITDMHFMLQKEVVNRITASPGTKTFGRLSVMMQYFCDTEALFDVGPENFTPPPKVDSSIVRLQPKQHKPICALNEEQFEAFVKQSFSQKRKTLRNNLKGWLNAEQIESLGLNPAARAETLAVDDFVRMANLHWEMGEWPPM